MALSEARKKQALEAIKMMEADGIPENEIQETVDAFKAKYENEAPKPGRIKTALGWVANKLGGVSGAIRGGLQGLQESPSAMGQQYKESGKLALQGAVDPNSVKSYEDISKGFGVSGEKNIPISRPQVDPRMQSLPNLPPHLRQMVVTGYTSPAEIVGGLAEAATLTPLDLIPMGRVLAGLGRLGKKGGVALGAKAAGASGQAIEEASTRGGRLDQQFAHASRGTHGTRFADELENFEKNVPERAIVDKALAQTGKINIQPAIDALENAKASIPTKSGITSDAGKIAMDKIGAMIEKLKVTKSGAAKPGQAFKQLFDAEEYRKIRGILDEDIDWSQTWAKPFNRAMIEGRTAMKNALISSAPPEYAQAMKTWHDKIELGDEMKKMVGAEQGVRQDIRSGSFLSQVAKDAPGSPRRQLMKRYERYTGSKHLDEAEKAMRAREFGPEGKPSFVPGISPQEWMPSALYTHGVIPASRKVEQAGELMAGKLPYPILSALRASQQQRQQEGAR